MKTASILLSTAILIMTACEEPDTFSRIPEEDRQELQHWAGVLARYSVLHPEDSGRPDRPDTDQFEELIQMCESNPESWSYLYSAMAETIATIEPPEPTCQTGGVETYSEDEIGNSSFDSIPGSNVPQ